MDRAHNAKFKEAVQLLRFAYSRAAKLRFDRLGSGDSPVRGDEHVE